VPAAPIRRQRTRAPAHAADERLRGRRGSRGSHPERSSAIDAPAVDTTLARGTRGVRRALDAPLPHTMAELGVLLPAVGVVVAADVRRRRCTCCLHGKHDSYPQVACEGQDAALPPASYLALDFGSVHATSVRAATVAASRVSRPRRGGRNDDAPSGSAPNRCNVWATRESAGRSMVYGASRLRPPGEECEAAGFSEAHWRMRQIATPPARRSGSTLWLRRTPTTPTSLRPGGGRSTVSGSAEPHPRC
jgi:hypothetical protein